MRPNVRDSAAAHTRSYRRAVGCSRLLGRRLPLGESELLVRRLKLQLQAALQATGFVYRTWFGAPHSAEAPPTAVRELLEHHQHNATNLLRLAAG